MRFGCFGHLSELPVIAEAGFDFAELNLQELLALTDEQTTDLKLRLDDMELPALACSWILPPEADLSSPKCDRRYWLQRLERGAEISRQLGIRIWPFGCGIGRSIKAGNGSPEAQQARVCSFIAETVRLCSSYGISVALEPLGQAYSNYIHVMSDAGRIAYSCEELSLMCDLRHMTSSDDPVESLADYSDKIVYCHIDLPTGAKRLFPDPKDGFNYSTYLKAVSSLPCGLLSFEALDGDLIKAKASLKYIKEQIQAFSACINKEE